MINITTCQHLLLPLTLDFFLHICTGGSLSFWCRGKFCDAFGGGELHQEQLDDVMGQAV
jgi:hypothetical protein